MHRIIRRQLLQVTPIWQFLTANISTFKSNDKTLYFVSLRSSLVSILFMLQIFCTLLQTAVPCKASPKHTVRVHSLSCSQREPEEELWNNTKSKAGRMWQEEDTRHLCSQLNQSEYLTFLLLPPFLLIKKINSYNSWPALTSHHCWLATGTSHRGSKEAERRDVSLMNNKARCFFL